MVEEKTFELDHKDFVLDMCLDHYGKRLATCSADGTVKIYKRNNSEAGWQHTFTTPQAKSDVIKVAWSHPEFSSLLACCTSRLLLIWEEEEEGKWKLLYQNEEFPTDICGLEFGPKHLGMRLGLSMANGIVEIYSPTDALRREWIKRHAFGTETDSKGDMKGSDAALTRNLVMSSLSWNGYAYDSRSMAVSHGNEAHIWRMDKERRKWKKAASGMVHKSVINHIAWAPNMGRSFHMIATASSDGTVQIWSVKAQSKEDGPSVLGTGALEVKRLQTLEHHSEEDGEVLCEVFRVEWNLTGTMLAASCDDGIVRLWTPNFKGEWQLQRLVDDSPESRSM